jgi:hypothetical protein
MSLSQNHKKRDWEKFGLLELEFGMRMGTQLIKNQCSITCRAGNFHNNFAQAENFKKIFAKLFHSAFLSRDL